MGIEVDLIWNSASK